MFSCGYILSISPSFAKCRIYGGKSQDTCISIEELISKQSHQSKTSYKYMIWHIDKNCFKDWSQSTLRAMFCSKILNRIITTKAGRNVFII